MSRTLKVVVAYDGTRLVGWQRQPEGVSVQGLLEDALAAIEGRPVAATAAGRTDAGVHALGQVVSLTLDHGIPPAHLARALNAVLPADVRVVRVEEETPAFHARYSAREKTYRYLIAAGAPPGPFEARYVWHVPGSLSVERMAAAAVQLEGEHDFAAFQSVGGANKTTVRRITRSEVRRVAFREVFGFAFEPPASPGSTAVLCYEVTGNGFLRHMVRAMVGTLVQIGAGRQEVDWLGEVLRARDRSQAGPTAPACGLFLVGVGY